MVKILMMAAKMATLDFLKINLFLNKSYDVINFVHDITNKILSNGWNYYVGVVMWKKSNNSSVSMREVIKT